jgi:hypothetical protein
VYRLFNGKAHYLYCKAGQEKIEEICRRECWLGRERQKKMPDTLSGAPGRLTLQAITKIQVGHRQIKTKPNLTLRAKIYKNGRF